MDKKQILKITLSVLFVGATVTTAAYVMRYNVCPRIKIISFNKEAGSVNIKWAGKEHTFDKAGSATHLSWTAKLEDDKLNVYNKKQKLIKSYNLNQVFQSV